MPSAMAVGDLGVDIASAGTKKVEVTWTDGTAFASGPFDAYWVTLDNDANVAPEEASRYKFVSASASPLSVTFSDLSSNTTYYADVYAVDFTGTGYTVVPATDQDPAGDALGTASAPYTPVSIQSSSTKVLSGGSVTISGRVSGITKATKIALLRDEYPQFNGADTTIVDTDDRGRWSHTFTNVSESAWYFAEYRAGPDNVGGWTGRITVDVRKRISIKVDPGLRVRAGTNVKFTGKVGGNASYLDDGGQMAKACLQRKQGTKWSTLFCRPLEPSGEYSLVLQPGQNASGKYRVFSGMGPAYADSWSTVKKLVVT